MLVFIFIDEENEAVEKEKKGGLFKAQLWCRVQD